MNEMIAMFDKPYIKPIIQNKYVILSMCIPLASQTAHSLCSQIVILTMSSKSNNSVILDSSFSVGFPVISLTLEICLFKLVNCTIIFFEIKKLTAVTLSKNLR